MKMQKLHILLAMVYLLLMVNSLNAAEIVKRYAVIVASNNGGSERIPLRYAETDALALTHVLQELGGLEEKNRLLLLEPSPEEIIDAVSRIQKKIITDKKNVKRSELFFYYSGHSDEKGLLLGESRLDYRQLKKSLTKLSSDVQIAVLDSCASGAFTRIKGGRHNPPFMQDESSSVKGYAILTSSSANENAQESDAIGGSYFTHYFVSALRGAGDTTLDKKITLNEAYQYAFHETLARTEHSMSGAQHAAYDFKLAGAGDLVLTELNNAVASVQLEKELGGRLFIRDQSGRLVVEINKSRGLNMEVSLSPQSYLVTLDTQGKRYKTVLTIVNNQANKQANKLSFEQFHRVNPEITVARGAEASTRDNLGNADGTKEKFATDLYVTKRRIDLLENYQNVSAKVSFAPGFSLPSKKSIADRDMVAFDLQFFGGDTDNANTSVGLIVSKVKEDIFGAQVSGVYGYAGDSVYGGQVAGIVSYTKGLVDGGQVGGITAINKGTLNGGQAAGIFALTGGNAKGGQGAGVVSMIDGDLDGGQGAGVLSIVSGDIKGGQGAGVVALAGGNIDGFQIAGVVNIATGDVTGFQVAGVANYATGTVQGPQVSAVVNVTSGVNEGSQVGLVNISQHAKKAQVGFVNITKQSDGIAFGFINLIGNGRFDVGGSYDESKYNSIYINSGAKHIYNHLSIGHKTYQGNTYKRIRWGVGMEKKYSGNWSQDYEFLVGTRLQEGDTLSDCTICSHYSPVYTLRSRLSYDVIPEFKLIMGVSVNIIQKSSRDKSEAEQYFGKDSDDVWPGVMFGVQTSF